MGARISIALNGLLNDPNVMVDLFTETLEGQELQDGDFEADIVCQKAKLKLSGTSMSWTFDAHVHDKQIFLEADFNYFRHEDRYRELMLMLFEKSICFKVIPG